MRVKFWEMKFDGTRYKDKIGIVWELDGTKHDFCAYIGDYYAVLTTNYTHKQLVDMEFEEYVDMEFEEYVDWSKVPIDTKILVWNKIAKQKIYRHFAGVDSGTGRVKAWDLGQTSFTTARWNIWDCAELYKEESEK